MNNSAKKNANDDEDVIEEIIAYDDEGGNRELIGDNDLFDEDEFEISNFGGENKDDDEFDRIVGCLQDIVIDPTFEILQKQFFEKHYQIFEECDENKLEYTPIFKEYQMTIENWIESKLKEMIADLDLNKFMKLLQTRKNEIEDELLDILLSFTDFPLFKDLMLSYKKQVEKITGKTKKETPPLEEVKANKENEPQNTIVTPPVAKPTARKEEKKLESDFGILAISGKATVIHKDMDSDGEERPDLQLDIVPIPTPKKVYSKANPKPETVKEQQKNKKADIFKVQKK